MTETLLMVATYAESLLSDGSAPDGYPNSQHRILTMMAQSYTESLLNDQSASNGCYLYRVTLE